MSRSVEIPVDTAIHLRKTTDLTWREIGVRITPPGRLPFHGISVLQAIKKAGKELPK